MLYIFKCQHDGNLDPLTVCSYIFVIFLLKDYRQKHPEVTILDPPDAIKHLHNRQSMLQDVADLNLSDCNGKVRVPRQMVITKDSLSIPDQVFEAGLKLPLVAKPLVVDGSAKSHELFLAYDRFSLSELEPPMLLQEFVNHGGVLFKIYIIGETIKVVRRFSLPNVSKRELAKVVSVFRFPRVSSAAASADDADLDPGIAELPPRPLLERLARELRHRLGLRLFNIDMIREHGMRDVFYVIDINYFPGSFTVKFRRDHAGGCLWLNKAFLNPSCRVKVLLGEKSTVIILLLTCLKRLMLNHNYVHKRSQCSFSQI
ncbi:Inositol-tetrakisphosphate 1-kinase 3 [Citrus sinensis]|uniref:Inositol-tetrakisphosphate 1-kinase 3 n=1 Tax=Citrus sinensis TaxID=2711 RepID=A0ACB8IDC9_CITSI|nr:Inositol-tetrakisphosphate 1-kinase 3 [Citrus sinensis]